jgi:hypothetical protein
MDLFLSMQKEIKITWIMLRAIQLQGTRIANSLHPINLPAERNCC